jgi:hypothetical protein
MPSCVAPNNASLRSALLWLNGKHEDSILHKTFSITDLGSQINTFYKVLIVLIVRKSIQF